MFFVKGTPAMFIMSVIYALYLVGPVSLVGCVIILLFYPIMVCKICMNNKLLPFYHILNLLNYNLINKLLLLTGRDRFFDKPHTWENGSNI